MFLCHPDPPRAGDLALPGVTISPRVGPGTARATSPSPGVCTRRHRHPFRREGCGRRPAAPGRRSRHRCPQRTALSQAQSPPGWPALRRPPHAIAERPRHDTGTNRPRPLPALGPAERWQWLPFFEAYFSNFIAGTEFGVDEARRIALDGLIPSARPADAHDSSATYQLTSQPAYQARTAASAEELLDMLHDWHALLMAARPRMARKAGV